jgi:hypothetical protein
MRRLIWTPYFPADFFEEQAVDKDECTLGPARHIAPFSERQRWPAHDPESGTLRAAFLFFSSLMVRVVLKTKQSASIRWSNAKDLLIKALPSFHAKMACSNFHHWIHKGAYLDPSRPRLPKISWAVLWKYVILMAFFPPAFALGDPTSANGSTLSDASSWDQLTTQIRESLAELFVDWLFPLTISGSSIAVYLSISQAKRSRASEYLSAVFAVASLALCDNRATAATKICVFFSGIQFQYLNWQNWIKRRIPGRGVRISDLTFILFVAMVIDAGVCALADSPNPGSDGFIQRYLCCTLAIGYVSRWAAFAIRHQPGLLPLHITDAARMIEP